jgi:hypothetical protein
MISGHVRFILATIFATLLAVLSSVPEASASERDASGDGGSESRVEKTRRVRVRGYTRRNGTYVRPYTRRVRRR